MRKVSLGQPTSSSTDDKLRWTEDSLHQIEKASYANNAIDASLTPIAGLAATNVQAAIEELDADIAALPPDTDTATGVSFTPAGTIAATNVQAAIAELDVDIGVRPLTADLTFYVRSDGSDSNTGLVDNAGGAFLTHAAAMAATASIDRNGYNLVVQSRLASSSVTVTLPPQIGDGTSTFTGNTATPANCLISVTGGNAIEMNQPGLWYVGGFKLAATGTGDRFASGNGLFCIFGAMIALSDSMDFGACAYGQAYAILGSRIELDVNYTISGSAENHKYADVHSHVHGPFTKTVTITGTPNFSDYFAVAWGAGSIEESSVTYSGAVTGKRFWVTLGSTMVPWTDSITYYPGDAPGQIDFGGLYNGNIAWQRNSLNPNAVTPADIAYSIIGNGVDTNGNLSGFGEMRIQIVDPTNGSLDGAFNFRTPVANAYATRLRIDGGLYHPSATGTDKGNNSTNFSAQYDDGTLLTCYVDEAARTGKVDFNYWDSKVENSYIPAVEEKVIEKDAVLDSNGAVLEAPLISFKEIEPARTAVNTHEPARKFAARLGTQYDPTTLAGQSKHLADKRHLTPYQNPDKFTEANRPSVGKWIQCGVEMDELLFLYVTQLEDRIKSLEALVASKPAAQV